MSNDTKSRLLKIAAVLCALAAFGVALSALLKSLIVAFWVALGLFLWKNGRRHENSDRHSGAEHFPG